MPGHEQGLKPLQSAAGTKRVMVYSAVEHGAHPASPTFRRARMSSSNMRGTVSTEELQLSAGNTRLSPTTMSPVRLSIRSPQAVPQHSPAYSGTSAAMGLTSASDMRRASFESFKSDDGLMPGGMLVPEFDVADDEVIKDFYESEQLLYRNFGVDVDADDEGAANTGSVQRGRDASRGPTPRGREASRGRENSLTVDSPAGSRRGSSRGRRASTQGSTEEAANAFEAERRSGMRRRGSSLPPEEGTGGSRRGSPGPAHLQPTSGSVNPAPFNVSFTAFAEPAQTSQPTSPPNENAPMFEIVATAPGQGDSSGPTSNDASPFRFGNAGSRSASRASGAGQHLAPAPAGRRKSLRGSWCEYPSGAPRALTSSARRTTKGVSLVDMPQEYDRYKVERRDDFEGECECDEERITRHQGKLEAATVDFNTLMESCVWCRRKPAVFLCLACGKAVCPSHVKAHCEDDPTKEQCTLFINMLDITTSFDKIFWCERCNMFTFKYTSVYEPIADALVNTRRTYLANAPATDIFMRHYQVRDKSKSSTAFADALTATFGEGVSHVVSNKVIASIASMQGWRATQEDSEVAFYVTPAALDLPDTLRAASAGMDTMSVFCVFDGHGGDAVARMASHIVEEHFVTQLKRELMRVADKMCADPTYLETNSDARREIFENALRETYVAMDDTIQNTDDGRDGYFGTVGCTALIVAITPLDVVCASAGDSRACLFDCHRGRCIALSEDHTLDQEEEVRRVEEAGYGLANGRIEGQLAVPRALGDYDFKQCGSKGPLDQAVSCRPSVTVVSRASLALSQGEEPAASAARLPPKVGASSSPLKPTKGTTAPEDWFVVLGCDGIWDVLSNEDCCTMLNEHFLQGKRDKQLETYQSSVLGDAGGHGFAPASSPLGRERSESASPKVADEMSPTRRRSRPGSLRGGQHHPANNVLLFANTLNDIVASSICAVLKRCLKLEKDEEDPAGMDNMSLVVARLAPTV